MEEAHLAYAYAHHHHDFLDPELPELGQPELEPPLLQPPEPPPPLLGQPPEGFCQPPPLLPPLLGQMVMLLPAPEFQPPEDEGFCHPPDDGQTDKAPTPLPPPELHPPLLGFFQPPEDDDGQPPELPRLLLDQLEADGQPPLLEPPDDQPEDGFHPPPPLDHPDDGFHPPPPPLPLDHPEDDFHPRLLPPDFQPPPPDFQPPPPPPPVTSSSSSSTSIVGVCCCCRARCAAERTTPAAAATGVLAPARLNPSLAKAFLYTYVPCNEDVLYAFSTRICHQNRRSVSNGVTLQQAWCLKIQQGTSTLRQQRVSPSALRQQSAHVVHTKKIAPASANLLLKELVRETSRLNFLKITFIILPDNSYSAIVRSTASWRFLIKWLPTGAINFLDHHILM
ncbi:unnamed protein product [Trichogramma brassicae]|uniref:Uncharacterized protein n=1 Tax=Trichogramma brassicae TaxID=86971 RepID=A0A6H5IGF9_9HYME|nr:unnamed protein product [Trichogramma brassicae]